MMDRRGLLRGIGVGAMGMAARRVGWVAGWNEPDVPVAKTGGRDGGGVLDGSGRLVEFAKSGVPGDGWPVYGLERRETMVFARVSKVVGDPRGEERRMMAGAGYRQPGT